jgi:hypothetical protein
MTGGQRKTRQKITTIALRKSPLRKWRPRMRKGTAAALVSLAALAVLAAPVLAKSPGAEKAEEKQVSSPCHSYVQNPDGSWTPVPCQEIGAPTQKQHKSPGRHDDDTDTDR